jgi:Zn-dependent M28 family amino/carboxypeptidase
MEDTMRRFPIFCGLTVLVFSLLACGGPSRPAPAPSDLSVSALPLIDGNAVLEHVKVLSSDEYEGRAPGTRGEELSVAYMVNQLKGLGLKPGNSDGTYIQKVPLAGIAVQGSPVLSFRKGNRRQDLKWKDDYVAWTKRFLKTVTLDNSEMVFVGYGVQAPEYSWDDYKGVDLKGKTMVVLIGDPPVPDPADPAALDPKTFGGRAMTYYGRWSYKYEMGAKMGAAAVLIVHETEPAAYPFSVVQSKVTEQFDLVAPDKNMGRVAVEGWITRDQAKTMFAAAGKDFEALKKAAVTRAFKPVPLGTTASVTLQNRLRTIDSTNVVARLEGGDPVLKDECVIYSAHWDHFGIGPEINGDKIYHGAIDNASGIGGVIELARAFTKVTPPPKRSVLVLFVTAEEQGLLGSTYYALHPIYPLVKTAGVINIDALNVHGRTKDLVIVGLGNSDLDDIMQGAAAEQGRILTPDPKPENGSFFRSDHFSFAKLGVPAINPGGGVDFIGRPADWGLKILEDYTRNDYHKPSDKVRPDWDLSGAVEDLQLYLAVGYRVANADRMPEWKPGSEFKARRDEQLSGRK